MFFEVITSSGQLTRIILTGLLLLTSACTPPPDSPTHLISEGLQVKYDSSCKSCHEQPATGAPQKHAIRAWQPRLAKGMETLMSNTQNGFGGMPPLGQCFDCSEADLKELILYMAGSAP